MQSTVESNHTRNNRIIYNFHERNRNRNGNGPPDSSETSSISSNNFEDSHNGSDDNRTSTLISSVKGLTTSTHSDPSAQNNDSHVFVSNPSNDVNQNTRDQSTSPIQRSLQSMPGDQMRKVNIADRKGWLPSLGPLMFELKMAQNNEAATSSRAAMVDTDI